MLKAMLEAWAAGTIAPPPIVRLLGMKLVSYEEGAGTLEFTAGPAHRNAMGTLHGGVLCDAADVAMGVALASVLEEGATFTTLALNAAYFKTIREAHLTAVGRVIRRGRTTAFCECEIRDDDGTLVAKMSSTCLVLPATQPKAEDQQQPQR